MAGIQVYILPIAEAAKISPEYCMEHFPDRFSRSGQFRMEGDRLRSIAAGALLSRVLGLREDEISVGRYGKPCCESISRQFNLSHSGEYAVLAVCERQVGVDIEPVGDSHSPVAKRVMQPEELRWMDADPAGRFSVLWTMKEAASKALGMGLNLPFESFSVLPLLRGEAMTLSGEELYGKNIILPGYSLSVCAGCKTDRVELHRLTWNE